MAPDEIDTAAMTPAALQQRDPGALFRGLHDRSEDGVRRLPGDLARTKEHAERPPFLRCELQATDVARRGAWCPRQHGLARTRNQRLLESPQGLFRTGYEKPLQPHAMR